jgi:hypothetical protein
LDKRVTCCLLVAIVCAWPYVYTQSQTPKITKIKLEDYGWQPVPNRPQFGHTFRSNLQLDHNDRVLVGFTVRESDALATREHPERSFHILRFTPEGKADLSLDLPTNDWYKNGFYLSADDEILAAANDTVQWISGSHGESESWQPLASCPEHCSIRQSFSRRTLILRIEPLVGGRDHSAYTILDASSSPPRVVRSCPQMASMQITDKLAYLLSYDRDDDLAVRFSFCDVDHYEELTKLGRRPWGYILNDETFLRIVFSAPRGPVKAELVGVDGRVRFSKEVPKHDSINSDKIATDERYDRFAFMVNTERGEHPHLDIGGHLVARRVVVLDAIGREIASIPTDVHYHMDSNFSMSPDGHRIAILDEGVVTVVDLE